MNLATETSFPRSRFEPHLSRIAFGLWLALGLATVGRALFLHGLPRHTGGFGIFMQAGENWLQSQPLYQPGDHLQAFRNSPLLGAAFTPLSLLKASIASAVLRALSFGAVVIGLWCLVRDFTPECVRRIARPSVFLLAIVLCFQPLGDVQTNGLSAGFIAISIAMVQRRKFAFAAALLVLAVHIKAYPIAVLLLLIALFPRQMAPPTIVAAALSVAVTFLFQLRSYVADQWQGWIRYGLNNRQGPGGKNLFRDIRTLLRVFHVELSPTVYLGLEAAMGLAVLCWVFRIRDCASRSQLLLTTYILAAVWMTVFGPATESQTHVHLAPACAILVWMATRPVPWRWAAYAAVGGWALLAIPQIALWFPRGSSLHLFGLHAAGGLLVAAATIGWSARPASQEDLA